MPEPAHRGDAPEDAISVGLLLPPGEVATLDTRKVADVLNSVRDALPTSFFNSDVRTFHWRHLPHLPPAK